MYKFPKFCHTKAIGNKLLGDQSLLTAQMIIFLLIQSEHTKLKLESLLVRKNGQYSIKNMSGKYVQQEYSLVEIVL